MREEIGSRVNLLLKLLCSPPEKIPMLILIDSEIFENTALPKIVKVR